MDAPECADLSAFVDQFTKSLCRGQRVLLIDFGRRTEMGDVISECPTGGTERLSHGLQIASDPLGGRPGARNRRFNLLGRSLEKLPHSEHSQLLFAGSKGIK